MRHDFTGVKNIFIICGKTDMRNYGNCFIMESDLRKALKNRKVFD